MISMIVAQTAGLFLLILGIIMLSRPARFKLVMQNLNANSDGLLFNNAGTLLAGCLLMVMHNNWHTLWSSLISLVGWSLFFKGIVWLVFPDEMIALTERFSHGKLYILSCLLTIFFGILLLIAGFGPIFHLV